MRKKLAKLLDVSLGWCGLTCLRRKDWETMKAQNDLFCHLLDTSSRSTNTNYRHLAEGIVFSMDRACQLHALLTTFYKYVTEPVPLQILYRASHGRHAKAYDEVGSLFTERSITWHKERYFREQLLTILKGVQSRFVFFLVDDIIFIQPVNFTAYQTCSPAEFVPSLRLGKHLDFCYARQCPMPLPPFLSANEGDSDTLTWIWEEGESDWGYPLSLDGHLFDPWEISIIAEQIYFTNPSNLEKRLQLALPLFQKRKGICLQKSCIVNLPINKVQGEINNVHGNIHQNQLLEKWELNYQIDVAKLYNTPTRSVHQELPISFISRTV